jgi:hypothetical protein
MKRRSSSVEGVTITPLHNDGTMYRAKFIDVSEEEMKVQLSSGLEVGSLLRLEVGDDLMMTEVCGCEPSEGEFMASLQILSRLERAEWKRLRDEAFTRPSRPSN